MKNKKIILIIILIVMAVLLSALMIKLLNNKISFNFITNYTISDEIVINEEIDDTFNSIIIESDAADIHIIDNESDKIKIVAYGNKNNIQINKNDNLEIISKQDDCHFFCLNVKVSKIEIYLPHTYNKEIKIKNSYGNITVGSFDQARLFVNEKAGDVDIDSVLDLDVENNYGDVNVELVNNYLNIKQDCGDVRINKLDIKQNSKIKNDLGNIEIGQTNQIRINANTDLGNVKIKNNYLESSISLDLENDCGNITVKN